MQKSRTMQYQRTEVAGYLSTIPPWKGLLTRRNLISPHHVSVRDALTHLPLKEIQGVPGKAHLRIFHRLGERAGMTQQSLLICHLQGEVEKRTVMGELRTCHHPGGKLNLTQLLTCHHLGEGHAMTHLRLLTCHLLDAEFTTTQLKLLISHQ